MIERITHFHDPEFLKAVDVLGPRFSGEMQIPFDPDIFKLRMQTLNQHGILGVWAAYKDREPIGMIAGTFVPDIYSTDLVGQVLFWFMLPENRGPMESMSLFDRVQEWWKTMSVDRMNVSHLHRNGSEGISSFLMRGGFEKLETVYMKRA